MLIPAHNAALTLRRALRSALNQDGVTVEACVVDDGSTDGTSRLLATMPENVKWLSKPNGGVASALNAAAELAGGKYLLVLAADDWLEQGALAGLKAVLDIHTDPMFAYGAYRFWGRRSDTHIPPPFERAAALRHNPVTAPLARREIWDAGVRWRDYDGVAEDWDWLLQVVQERGWDGVAVPHVLAYHYVHASGTLHERMYTSASAWAGFKAQWPMVTAAGF